MDTNNKVTNRKKTKKTIKKSIYEKYNLKELFELLETKEDDSSLQNIYKEIEKKIALSVKAEENPYETEQLVRGFLPLPDLRNKDFQKEIVNKKEFSIFTMEPLLENARKLHGEDKSFDELVTLESKRLCNTFRLSNNQRFLKNFINPNTPYNSLLLFHGTGVGKTCSSVSIAETFLDNVSDNDIHVYVLLNPSIQDSFRKNIFDISKIKKNMTESQCTRDKYVKYMLQSGIDIKKNINKVKKQIDKKINSNYSFLGYRQFSNKIRNIERTIVSTRQDLSTIEIKKLINERIRRMFSNSIFIIDEAHNIKEGQTDEKELTKYIEMVIKQSENMKLILLSATPMFNKNTEIIYLLNLLLMNEKRPGITEKEIFHAENLTEKGKKILNYKTQGLVSFLRGENPLRFPKKLYPSQEVLLKNYPSLTVANVPIEENLLKELPIVSCVMGKEQKKWYQEISETEGFGSFDGDGIAVSNLVFPLLEKEMSNKEQILEREPRSKIGNVGFNSCFKKKSVNNKLKIIPVDGLNMDFLKQENIGKYSTKIESILRTIKKSKGIVFIYSRFIWSGIVPLALALEMNGYKRTDGNLLDESIIPKNKHNGNYMIISGDPKLTKSTLYNEYLGIESENMDGSKVKVILGSESAAEGLDFKMIREVHILEPWHHLSRLDQVIGRAIRNCSHISLPLKERNVTVYHYASVLPKEESRVETVDLKLYREAIHKDKEIAKVVFLLKRNAVDCNINYYGNVYLRNDDLLKQKIKMVDSQGTEHNVYIGDEENDNKRECNYNKCKFTCNLNKIVNKKDYDSLDVSTYEIKKHEKDKLEEIKTSLYNLFTIHSVLSVKEIVQQPILQELNVDDNLIYVAIDELLEDKKVVQSKYGEHSHIVYKNGLLLVEPLRLTNAYPTLYQLQKESKKEQIILDASNFIKEKQTKKVKEKDKKMQQELDKLEKDANKPDTEELNTKLDKYDYNNLLYLVEDEIHTYCRLVLKLTAKELESEKYVAEKLLKENLIKMNILYESPELTGYVFLENKDTIRFVRRDRGERGFLFRLTPIGGDEQKIYDLYWNTKNKKVDYGPIVGYIMLRDKTPVFKIRDRRNIEKETKLTKIKVGSVCNSDGMSKNKINEYIDVLNKENETRYKSTDKKKSQKAQLKDRASLCKVLESEFLHAEKTKKDGKKWFLTQIDALKYSIFKRIL